MKGLTVCIPCLGEVTSLNACLASLAERLPGQEVLVVQMGGWAPEALQARGLHLRLIPAPRLSAPAARNLAARAATSTYLWFLDSDNWLRGEPAGWEPRLAAALLRQPELLVLQRAERGRHFPVGVVPNRWNFSRYCIEWNLIWARAHFFRLGGLDETCGVGTASLAQAGEAFALCFRHFESRGRTLYLRDLPVGHPDLAAGGQQRRRFAYDYGSHYTAMRQLRRRPSVLALYWFMRTLAGTGRDIRYALGDRRGRQAASPVQARFLAAWDALVRAAPRPLEER